jgi:hypothetical protein
MIFKDSLDFKKKKILVLEIQNGGAIKDGRQTIKCFRFIKNTANNLQVRI